MLDRHECSSFGARAALAAAAIAAVSLVFAGCADDDGGGNGADAERPDAVTDTGVEEPDTGAPDTGRETGVDTETRDTEPQFDGPGFDTRPPDSGDGGLRPMNIQTITPQRGPVSGGTKFVLSGEGLTEDTSVFFGSKEARVNLVNGDLVGQTPPAAGPGPVAVKAIDPDSGRDSLSQGYTYTTPLKIDSITPEQVPTEGGVDVRIEGQGFDSKARASFAGRTGLDHTVVDSETLRVKVPSNPAGAADVRVTTRSATEVREDGVEYVESLEIDRVRPATGTTSGGDRVTLFGSGFESGMTVTFGGVAGTVQSVQPDGKAAAVTTPAQGAGLVDVGVQTPSGDGALAEEAFYYRSSASEFAVAAVRPDFGQESGGTDVTLIGSGLDRNGLTVSFDGNSATVASTGPGHATVTTPAHPPGKVDVTASDGSGASDTLVDGFEYFADLEITGVTPARGSSSGGTSVTLTGTGFQGVSRVEFGRTSASYTVVSDTEIKATAPTHAPGRVDVVVERDPVEARLEEGYAYTEPLDVFGLNPVRGSRAGNTYVEIRGRGFLNSKMSVEFGGNGAKSIRVLDTQTIAVRTPKHPPASVDVGVERGRTAVEAPEQFTYFNPGTNEGGVWGGPIRGAVNVSVFSVAGNPVDGAFVMLSTSANTQQSGETDANGQVTLSGPDVQGTQTITATAPQFTSSTIQEVNSENVTIFLTPLGGSGPPPSPPPAPKFQGKLTGLDKIAPPEPDEYLAGVVFATMESPWDRIRALEGNVVRGGNGNYELNTRIGDLALVAIGGLVDENTQTMTPLRMGVKRFETAEAGETYDRDIDVDVKLDETMRFKLKNPPQSPAGPNINQVVPWLDFGFEGVFGRTWFAESGTPIRMKLPARGQGSIVETNNQPPLSNSKLSNVEIRAIGGSYTLNPNGLVGAPRSVAVERGITNPNQLITMPRLVGVPIVNTPGAGETVQNNLIAWNLNTSNRPDFYFVQILTPMGAPLWQAFAPGTRSSIRLPNFPSFSQLPQSKRPVPYPGGTFTLVVLGARSPTTNFNSFTYQDLQRSNLESFSVFAQQIGF